MKILEEIVLYLEQRGVLTAAEVEALEAKGFVRSEALRDYWDGYDNEDYDGEPPLTRRELDAQEPVLRPRARGASRRRSAIRAPAIAARARAWIDAQNTPLGALGRVIDAPESTTRWQRIARVGRSDPGPLATELTRAIDERHVSFNAIWEAICLDGYLDMVKPGEQGPAASAYRALLKAKDHKDTGKYLWLFRKRAIARVFDLMLAQRRVTEAFLCVYREGPALLGKWIKRDYHAVAYWSFVLLYNAERFAKGARWEAFSGEHPARRRLLDTRGLAQAFAFALDLGGNASKPFLSAFWDEKRGPEATAPGEAPPHQYKILFCPNGWD
jgi:hypothetical protein